MRWRVTYDLRTSTWHAFGRTVTLQAADQKQAIASAERYLYARKDHTLAERHDDAGEGFQVVITAVTVIRITELIAPATEPVRASRKTERIGSLPPLEESRV